MKFRIRDLWRFEGTLDRGPYVLIGLIGFAIKHNLDRFLASFVFGREWGVFNYWVPPWGEGGMAATLRGDPSFFGALVAAALPFIWVGLAQTMKRLRALGWPPALLVVFFMPFFNLAFFLLLGLLPSQQRQDRAARRLETGDRMGTLVPEHGGGAALVGVLVANLLALPFILTATVAMQSYGWSLFVGLPFVMGLVAVVMFGYHQRRSFAACSGVAVIAVALNALLLMTLAVEGVICIAMAVPLAALLALLGGWVGYLVQRRGGRSVPASTYTMVLLLPGALLTEYSIAPEPPTFEVRTAIEVDQPPAAVWREVVAFHSIPQPSEWLFRLGIAYPVRAEIHGTGPGAERHCVFSTGTFVEPIEIWQEARRLKFSVTSSPPPMREWTPFQRLRPPHLDGFLIASGGQFLLEPLPGGRTRLEGTTWYRHLLWPASYWHFLSDYIIQRIHLRVLRHIKFQVESPMVEQPRGS